MRCRRGSRGRQRRSSPISARPSPPSSAGSSRRGHASMTGSRHRSFPNRVSSPRTKCRTAPVHRRRRCIDCHNGARLTDNNFYNTGVPAAPDVRAGRAGRRPFNCLGPYSDAAPDRLHRIAFMAQNRHEMVRAFKTPSLRGSPAVRPTCMPVSSRTLDDVLDHYDAAPAAPAGHSELSPLHLDRREGGRSRPSCGRWTGRSGGRARSGWWECGRDLTGDW